MIHKFTSLYQLPSIFTKGKHFPFLGGILVSVSAGISAVDNTVCAFLQQSLYCSVILSLHHSASHLPINQRKVFRKRNHQTILLKAL